MNAMHTSVSYLFLVSHPGMLQYVVDYDSDTMIEAGSCIGDDDIYPLAQGEISDDSVSSSGGHCMMASHGDGNKDVANSNRDRPTAGGQFITQTQIQHARKVYSGRGTYVPKSHRRGGSRASIHRPGAERPDEQRETDPGMMQG
jgi:hypothetical protein